MKPFWIPLLALGSFPLAAEEATSSQERIEHWKRQLKDAWLQAEPMRFDYELSGSIDGQSATVRISSNHPDRTHWLETDIPGKEFFLLIKMNGSALEGRMQVQQKLFHVGDLPTLIQSAIELLNAHAPAEHQNQIVSGLQRIPIEQHFFLTEEDVIFGWRLSSRQNGLLVLDEAFQGATQVSEEETEVRFSFDDPERFLRFRKKDGALLEQCLPAKGRNRRILLTASFSLAEEGEVAKENAAKIQAALARESTHLPVASLGITPERLFLQTISRLLSDIEELQSSAGISMELPSPEHRRNAYASWFGQWPCQLPFSEDLQQTLQLQAERAMSQAHRQSGSEEPFLAWLSKQDSSFPPQQLTRFKATEHWAPLLEEFRNRWQNAMSAAQVKQFAGPPGRELFEEWTEVALEQVLQTHMQQSAASGK